MQFIKKFFDHSETIIGLSGLNKKRGSSKTIIPKNYKRAYIQNTSQNFLLL